MFSASTLLLGLAATVLAQSATSSVVQISTQIVVSNTNPGSTRPAATPTGATSTDLPILINQIPKCAVSCLARASTDIGCQGPADFGCLCTSSEKLTQSMGVCIVLAGCSQDDISQVASIAPRICIAYGQNRQNPAALASGTSAVSSLASAAGVTTGTKGNAAVPARTGAPLAAVVVAGAWAVMVL